MIQKYCEACGMPMNQKEDFALGDLHAACCVYCVNPDGSVKSCEEIFEGGVQFFMTKLGGDRKLAEKVIRKNMRMQSYWQGKKSAVLEGPVATEAEFAEIMKRMH